MSQVPTSGAVRGRAKGKAKAKAFVPAPSLGHQGARPSLDMAVRKEQFEAIAMSLANVLYATALRMVGNAAKAEDLVQETYVRAWQNFDRFTLGTNFKAWIFQILTFLYKNERRSAKSREATVDYSANDILPAPAESEGLVADAAGVNWDALYPDMVDDKFKRALDRLDEDQRSVLLLVTLGELSYQECADALGIPIGTVMSRLFRARKQLQEELTDYVRGQGMLRGSNGGEAPEDGDDGED